MSLTNKGKKIITILMIINFFALIVNFFGLKGNIIEKNDFEINGTTFNLFTHCKGFSYDLIKYKYEVGFNKNLNSFWPFVEFTDNNNISGFFFKGIFCYFDYTEFIFYTLLIFSFPYLIKILKK